MQVPASVKQQVNAKIQYCIDTAEKHYGRTFAFPTIVYKKRGTTAGTANDRTYTIDLNPTLLMENLDAFIARTVPHEFAHLVDGIVNPHTRMGRKRSVHGPSWKRIMMLFGADPSRCHSYDVTNAKQSSRRTTKHVWVCGCGEATMELGAKRHAKQLARKPFYVRGHTVARCGEYTYLGIEGQEQKPVAKAADAKQPKRKSGKVTKLDRCRNIYNLHKQYSRDMIVLLFQTQGGCTPAGAATYYAKISNE